MIRARVLTWLPLALLVAVPIATVPRLLLGESLFWGLPTLQFYPWRAFAFAELAAGHLPTWNPYVGAGAPLLANYQTAVFYPPNWLMMILPDAQVMSWIALLHVVWAGAGMWLFMRALGLPPFGRGISALAYALSGYLLGRLGSFPTLDSAAWLPWVIWLVHRLMRRRRLPDVGWLAAAFGLQLLAGHAQTTWYSTLAAAAYAVWLAGWAQRGTQVAARVRGLALTAAGLVVGAAIAGVQLLPTAEFWLESQRSAGVDFERLTNLSYHPMRLITLLSPNFFGTPADGSYVTEGIYFEDAAYIGFIPLIGALAALGGWWRSRQAAERPPALASVPFWGGLALAALLIAFGKHTPTFRALYDGVPTFDAFREPVRWLVLTVFGLAVLAGIGAEWCWPRGPRTVFWARLAAAGGGGMALMGLGALAGGRYDDNTLRVLTWGLIVLGCWVAGAALLTLTQPVGPTLARAPRAMRLWRVSVLLFVAFDLGWMATGLNPTVPSEFFAPADNERPTGRTFWTEEHQYRVTFGADEDGDMPIEGFFDVSDYRIARHRWREVRLSRLANISMLDEISSLNNNDPLLPRRHASFLELVEVQGEAADPLLRAAAVSHVYGKVPDGWRGANPAVAPYADDVAFAWLVPQALRVASDSAALAVLADAAWDPLQTAVLAAKPDEAVDGPARSVSGAVDELEASPTERHLRVVSETPAYLVVSQTWYPGWSASVNGQPAELFRANLTFQAVAVPSGESEVVLRYRPTHWRTGTIVSGLALILTGLLLASERWRLFARR